MVQINTPERDQQKNDASLLEFGKTQTSNAQIFCSNRKVNSQNLSQNNNSSSENNSNQKKKSKRYYQVGNNII